MNSEKVSGRGEWRKKTHCTDPKQSWDKDQFQLYIFKCINISQSISSASCPAVDCKCMTNWLMVMTIREPASQYIHKKIVLELYP